MDERQESQTPEGADSQQETTERTENGVAAEEPTKSEEEQTKETDYRVLVDNMSKEDLAALFQKAQEADFFLEALQKTQADYENYRKRMEREQNNIRLYAGQDIFKQFLGLLDNFQRAIASGNQGNIDKNFFEGICILEKEFQKILNGFGVKPIEALGKPFDPHYHEAMTQLEDAEHPPMTVIQEFDKGYLYHERVLRPSKVAVSRAPQKKEEQDSKESPAEQ